QRVRGAHLAAHRDRFAVLADDVEVEPRMRVDEVEARHRARDLDVLVHDERAEAVMGERCRRENGAGQEDDRVPNDQPHGSSPSGAFRQYYKVWTVARPVTPLTRPRRSIRRPAPLSSRENTSFLPTPALQGACEALPERRSVDDVRARRRAIRPGGANAGGDRIRSRNIEI